ncbi:GNAT family N-acetyltransferase [Staphylococcus warneri]|uniref:GNAT family N-acetyltransferase n=1 Tax=Staphylococcus warneri TaxID=1292 RepID=UPI00325FF304
MNQCRVYLLSDQHQSQSLAIAAVEKLSEKEIELKNIAVHPLYRRKGQGTYLMRWLFNKYRNMTMYVGTSDTESTLKFYYRLGFEDYDIRKNFFINHYAQPIYDNGKLLIDMIILKKDL